MAEEAAVRAPTLVLGVDEFGETILGRLEALSSALGTPPVRFLTLGSETPIPQVIEQIHGLLDELLRIQLEGPRARLDIVLIADLEQAGAGAKAEALCAGLSQLLASQYGRMFPPSAPPDQRMVFLVPVFATPALSDNPETRSCLSLLHDLESWHSDGPPSPILSRVYLLPRQHELGVMAEEDVERAVYMFAAAAWFSGLRDEPKISGLLSHTRPERLVSCFNAAAADVPVDSVVRYFGWRTTAVGLEILQTRCARHRSEFGARGEAETALDFKAWLRGVEEGEGVRAARNFGRDRPLAPAGTSVRDRFRWSESSAAIRSELQPILEELEAAVPEPQPSGARIPSDTDDVVVRLDRAEERALREAKERIRAYVDRELDPRDGLRRFGEIDGVLALVEAWLRDRETESSAHPLTGSAPVPRPSASAGASAAREGAAAREGVERALAARPGVLGSFALAALLLVVVLPASIGIRAAFGSATNWGAATNIAGVDWVLHGLLLGLVAGVWVVLRLSSGAHRLRRAVLELRRVRDDSQEGPAPLPTGPTGHALALRRSRVAGMLAGLLADERRRLQGLRAAVAEAARRAEAELTRLGYQPAQGSGPGDASGVLGLETPLHLHLLAADKLEALWRQSRHTTDDEGWAAHLLREAWPADGLAHDLPFDDALPGWVEEARSGQHGVLLESSVFAWPGLDREVSDRLAHFLQAAPSALGLGADPHDEHGNPLPANASQDLLVVAPQEGRDVVRVAQKKSGSRLDTSFGVAPTSHVVILRTHAGFTSRQLWSGIERRQGG